MIIDWVEPIVNSIEHKKLINHPDSFNFRFDYYYLHYIENLFMAMHSPTDTHQKNIFKINNKDN